MKICPTCRQVYNDDNVRFCLNDGATLTPMQNQPPASPSFTNQPPAGYSSFGNQAGGQQNWSVPTQQYSPAQPQKSSKAWLWAVGIIGLIVVLCGGGFGLMAIIGYKAEKNFNNAVNSYNVNSYKASNNPFPDSSSNKNTTITNMAAPVSNPDGRKLFLSDDLEGWVITNSQLGNTTYGNDELTIGSKEHNHYYVITATKEFTTEDATTKVTLRNTAQAKSAQGYGLVFHSDITPLQKGYAFLIDTVKQRYRVVYHTPGDEHTAITWTTSGAIRPGAEPNVLEVRDSNGTMDFYINDQKVNTLKNTQGEAGGIAGLYAGDAAQISFSKLEIYK